MFHAKKKWLCVALRWETRVSNKPCGVAHLWGAGDDGADELTAEGMVEFSADRSTVAMDSIEAVPKLLELMPRSTPADSGRTPLVVTCAITDGYPCHVAPRSPPHVTLQRWRER